MTRHFGFARRFATAGFFFPAANVFNFAQGHDALATSIAVANLLVAILLIGGARFPALFQDRPLSKTILDQLSEPLRLSAYCLFVISAVLLFDAWRGSQAALFPGFAALFYAAGNYIQSDGKLAVLRQATTTMLPVKAILHPAIWFGLGYTVTGIAIGGGLRLFHDPLGNLTACFLTLIGIAETTSWLGLLATGKVVNQAAPFVGIVIGAIFFGITSLIEGNMLGTLTVSFACMGELSLAVLMQQSYNLKAMSEGLQKPPSRIETILTAPILWTMKRGWISTLPVLG